MDALKAELEVRQNQINALIRRNDELAGSAPVAQSSNARVSCFRWSQTCLLTFLTLGSLLTPAFAVDPLVCMPHSPQNYIRLPAPLDCSKASSPEPHPVVYKELTIYRPNTIASRLLIGTVESTLDNCWEHVQEPLGLAIRTVSENSLNSFLAFS
uniref:Uncharacterized protein n=1 Tax=Caenorhabditis japonica TaxID=281687 RepID=A0A8R1ENI2_CAEJA